MKCHYEELGVARDASDAEIKTAYRKLALRWHPDKNPDCTEAAKERFQLIQQAYDVLSDSQERAWYDNHREQILRGKNSEYEDNCLDLFQYFTVSCFKGYGDDERGFYRVYSHVFEKIAEEDAEFIEDEEAVASIPKFGDSNSSYEEVVGPFYAYWQSYCTKRTYSWLCPYDVQEIKDRRILREIEKDMKKIVQKAKKERNEEVRNLVSFIRKRDKRVQQYKQLLEERAALNRLKQEQNRLEQIRRRNRELEEMRRNHSHTFNDGYEEQLKQLEQQYGSESSCEEEDESEDELDEAINVLSMVEEEEYVDDLYCVACNKAFKNENAFANHETSKKHRDNLERLKKEMLEEEELYGEEHEDGSSQEESYKDGESQAEGTDGDDGALGEAKALAEDEKKASKKEKKDKKSKKGKKMCTQQKIEPPFSEDEELSALPLESRSAEEREEVDWSSSSKRGAGKKAKTKQSKSKSAESKAKTKSPHETPPQNTLPVEVPAPRAASPSETAAHTCVTCKAGFESKNKLFAHLKKLNHGVYIPKPKAEPLDTSKKSKSKRK